MISARKQAFTTNRKFIKQKDLLRKIRIAAAAICFTMITLLFLDFTGTIHAYMGWLAKIQLLPAVLALNVGVVVALVVLTLLLGRVYCSVICPLGVMQDIISWFAGKRKKNRFSYSPAKKWLRYGVLVVFIATLIAGFGAVALLVAPYSAFGRIAQNLFAPLWAWAFWLGEAVEHIAIQFALWVLCSERCHASRCFAL